MVPIFGPPRIGLCDVSLAFDDGRSITLRYFALSVVDNGFTFDNVIVSSCSSTYSVLFENH